MKAICKQGWLSMFKQLFIFLTLLLTFILTSLPSHVKALEARDGAILNQEIEREDELEALSESQEVNYGINQDEENESNDGESEVESQNDLDQEDLRVRSPAIIREDLEELEEVERQSLMNASLNEPTITSQKEAQAIGRSPNSAPQESLYDQRQLDALIRITERARLTTTN